MHKKVGITGMGIISAIGKNVEENFDSLIHQKHGLSCLENFDSIHKNEIFVGEIKLSNDELATFLNLSSENNFSRTAMLGLIAVKEALKNAGIENVNEVRTGLISSTSVGGMDMTENYFLDYENLPEKQKYISSHDAGASSNQIANEIGLKGFVSTISTACSSAANAIMYGARLINSGKLDRVIVGGTDALSKFTINGFKSLMILSDEFNQPFDENRKGLNLGEAAAYLVLESEESVQKSNKKVLGYLVGAGNANDAFHQTASSENGEGAYLAMKKAFETSIIQPSEIDYINVHGTATNNNDITEGRALKRIFRENVPNFSSTKPFTGHTLAAAASVEAVFSLLSIQHNLVYPNLNFQSPIEELNIFPTTKLEKKDIEYVLSNSFGFGGNCSTLIFSKS
ncbi:MULTISPECIES: beta-ketoacyl-[acyl-carrier-protein] synthase family protein [Empedobacter]|uniref:beta-ketoacyl-[acyl-carrier-protein] synthase family protein n=1 Tax=Empedobacter TaxID=59734 RepID=UPI00244C4781|nr:MULTISPECIES: beta-ketoacyl-[acyl-carrier-protein] synthase family protein [unclassified Empedobacter]MDH0674598.1 beta-ketoacyl-[acyl-carrier-protein] synthase family protein [Empedobacter sp. GD03861]MDM1138764.1 beta-ketoacyl-[acyl-carrier-protein] synthase family protein [Empedobacter sp. R132-2]